VLIDGRDVAGVEKALVVEDPAIDLEIGLFFDELPVPDASADLVVSCASFTTDAAHGGDAGLAEMERVAKVGALIAFVWPSDVEWLRERGFDYETFDGDMDIDFGTLDQAVELAGMFYPWAVEEIERRGAASVPYDVIGMNAPRDLAWKRAGISP
jgi:SAM-dependent methyltransferase